MMHLRPFRSLIALVVAILIAAGPGSPLCSIARAAMPAMAGCDMPGPAKDKSVPPHPDCASPCVAIACPAPAIADRPAKPAPPESRVLRLAGIVPIPETEPPRS